MLAQHNLKTSLINSIFFVIHVYYFNVDDVLFKYKVSNYTVRVVN